MFLPLILWLISTIIVFIILVSFNLYFLYNIASGAILLITEQKAVWTKTFAFYYYSSEFFLYLILLVFGILIGWIIEIKFKWIDNLNRAWQIKQPWFYKILHHDFRSLIPWLILSLIALMSGLIYYLLLHNGFGVLFIIGFCIGLLIRPLIKLREMFMLDRPEKPPQAIIHKLISQFPMSVSIWMGQTYIKVLLPLFFIFILSILPLWVKDELFLFSNFNELPLIVIFTVFIGIIIHWGINKKEYVFIEKLKPFLFLKVCVVLLISVILISYGIFSENIIVLILCGILAGINLGTKDLYKF